MKYLFQEEDLNKKKEKIINIYENIIKENNYKSKDILFLVPSSITKLSYMREINLPLSEELKITTYSHFVQSELIKYWPIIEDNCEKIKVNKISPSFISQSLSEYIIMEYINKTREEENYFQDIVGTNKSICKSVLDNLSKSCFNGIDINNIGEKIYNSKKNRNDLNRYSYTQMQEVIDFYLNTLLSKGIIDNSIAVYLYNNFLLNNEEYRSRLRKEYRYLIVDSLESASVSEGNLIVEFLNIVEDGYVFYDRSKDYSSFKNVDITYNEENIINKLFKDDVDNLGTISIKWLYKKRNILELKDEYHLYDEMIDGIVEKLLQLMKEGKNLKDIVIISPINNSILDYRIL